MKRIRIFATLMLAFGLQGVRAQGIPVIDTANLAQTVRQVMNDITAIRNQVQQITQLQSHLDSINGIRRLGQVFNNPLLKNYIPAEAYTYLNAIDTSGYSGLNTTAKALRDAAMVYNCLDLAGGARTDCQAALAQPYQQKGLLQDAMKTAAGRLSQINSLMDQINGTSDQKAIQEVQARIGAENALLAHEMSQVQMLQGMADSEERIARSRERERQYQMLGRTGKIADFLPHHLPLIGAPMNTVLDPGSAAAWPDRNRRSDESADADETASFGANRAWEMDRAMALERSERRAWWVAVAGSIFGLIGIAAVFAQGPLRRVVEIPIVVDRVTGEATIQQRLAVETIPPMEALDKHNLAVFVRAREAYSWMFLQRDFDQVARMAVPGVFADYNRQFEGDAALQKRLAAAEEWRIVIVGVRLAASGRTGKLGNGGEATVTYDKVVRLIDRNLPDVTTRHVASVVFQYQPKVLTQERDRLENPFGFVVTAYRSDPEIVTVSPGARP